MQRLFESSEHFTWGIRGTELTFYIEHTKVFWMIRTFLLRNKKHWTHPLYWNVKCFEWLEHPFWKIRGTGRTAYNGTCKCCLIGQNNFYEKSEALDLQPMLEHTYVVQVIRISLLGNQRYWTHSLCQNIHTLFEWSEYLFWEIRGTGPTAYVGTCKCYLNHKSIFSEKSEALHSLPILRHAKVVWVLRTSLLKNQRYWTHSLY